MSEVLPFPRDGDERQEGAEIRRTARRFGTLLGSSGEVMRFPRPQHPAGSNLPRPRRKRLRVRLDHVAAYIGFGGAMGCALVAETYPGAIVPGILLAFLGLFGFTGHVGGGWRW